MTAGPVNSVATTAWIPVNGGVGFEIDLVLPFVDVLEFPDPPGQIRAAEYTDGILMCAVGRNRVMYASPCGAPEITSVGITCPEACD